MERASRLEDLSHFRRLVWTDGSLERSPSSKSAISSIASLTYEVVSIKLATIVTINSFILLIKKKKDLWEIIIYYLVRGN